MAIDSDIRDQAYQFFIQEAPELLQAIEVELLTLKQERTTPKVHSMMRAAHSIKGGAASVGLDTIKTIAHRLEDIFKALHYEELEVDDHLETLLLQAYDCLRLPLMEQLEVGHLNAEQALAVAEPIFLQIEEQLKDFLDREDIIPSSVDLGIDIALSIFEVDVAEGLDRLDRVLGDPEHNVVAGELRAQSEVFSGISELLSMPGFGAIATTTLTALDLNPDRVLDIAQLALADFRAAQAAVLEGDRTQGGSPSAALTALASFSTASEAELNLEVAETELPFLDEIFGSANGATQTNGLGVENNFTEAGTSNPNGNILDLTSIELIEEKLEPDIFSTNGIDHNISVDDIFAGAELLGEPQNGTQIKALTPPLLEEVEVETASPSVDDIFGSIELLVEPENGNQVEALTTALEEVETASPSVDDIFGSIELLAEPENGNQVEALTTASPSVDDIFGNVELLVEPENGARSQNLLSPLLEENKDLVQTQPQENNATQETLPASLVAKAPESIPTLVKSIEQAFDSLPQIEGLPATLAPVAAPKKSEAVPEKAPKATSTPAATPGLSIRVDLERLERMNNLVGELSINRNSLSLQNEQLQGTVQELLRRFAKVQDMATSLRDLSDRMVIAPERQPIGDMRSPAKNKESFGMETEFDSLEMDSYGELHSLLSETLEEMVQLEETVGDVALLTGQSNQTIESQRQMLTHLRDDLMWARMLPLSEILSRFPRTLRDLSTSYKKPVDLKLSGTGVLVDKAVLEKLYDTLLHLLRNAFDHGIEPAEVRRQRKKPERGTIEIRAYHQGSQTVIEVRDNGKGINVNRVKEKALDLGLLSPEQAATISTSKLLDFLFEPGFSTASQVSELSGRGVGLDVVRSQLRALKGSVTVNSTLGRGTTFTLRIPLTLTIAKLLVGVMGVSAYAFPADTIEEIIIPKSNQIKQSAKQRFLHWRKRIIPIYRLDELVNYAVPLPEASQSLALASIPTPDDWAAPVLLLRQDNQFLALEIDRVVTEQELVIKPFGSAIAPPNYIYGCTILGDGSVIPVMDCMTLLNRTLGQEKNATTAKTLADTPVVKKPAVSPPAQSSSILVVDDSIAMRQTLALTLQKAGYRVLQAKDGREAVEQLQHNAGIGVVVCDIEMPNMNGFEFLSHRRQDPQLLKVPVIMLTSRSSDKHKRLAKHLGANDYFTKPYLEQELIAGIQTLLNSSTGKPALATAR